MSFPTLEKKIVGFEIQTNKNGFEFQYSYNINYKLQWKAFRFFIHIVRYLC